MSSRDKTEAEREIANAFFVLECIVHNDKHLRDVGNAIDAYVAGDFKSAAILAHAVVKARSTKDRRWQSAVPARALSELQRMFRAARHPQAWAGPRGPALSSG
jgi:hypothetical protein